MSSLSSHLPSTSPAPDAGWAGHLQCLAEVVSLRAAAPADAAVLAQARRLLLDTLACAFAGQQADEVRQLRQVLEQVDPGPTQGGFMWPGQSRALGVHAAVQVFAMAATWDEACEGSAFAHGRPGVPLVAALWPLALARGASLQALLDALVLGYEVGARAGGWLRIQPGMHVDANWPSIGVAAGVAHLLGLAPPQVLQAMHIAACQLGTSLYLPVRQGHTSRNTYLAHSALLGMQSAFAAAAGVTAPPDAMGHYASSHARALQDPLPPASRSLLLEGYLKPFAAVRHVHYGAVAAAQVREALQVRGLDVADITAVSLCIYEEATVYCGNRDPRTVIQAQFSLSFGVAAMLRFGTLDPSVYRPECFGDAGLRRMEALVDITVDARRTTAGHRGASLQVQAAGQAFNAIVDAVPGDAGCPVDDAMLRDKFMRYTAEHLSPLQARRFCDALLEADARAEAMETPGSLGRAWQFVLLTEQ